MTEYVVLQCARCGQQFGLSGPPKFIKPIRRAWRRVHASECPSQEQKKPQPFAATEASQPAKN